MISVVVPAYNEEKTIAGCLDALVRQKTSMPYEVILVDNNSTDRTADKAKEYKNRLNLRIINEKQKGRGPARCAGFAKASGDIILSTDADTIVPENWIEAIVNRLQKSNASALTGLGKISDCGWFKNNFFNFLQPLSMKLYNLVFGHYWLNGFNFAVYRKSYKQSGGFDPRLNIQEDVDLARKISKIGEIKLVEDIPVVFSGRRFQKDLLRGLISYLTTFIGYYVFKRSDVVLSDVR